MVTKWDKRLKSMFFAIFNFGEVHFRESNLPRNQVPGNPRGRFNSIQKRNEKRPEKGPESKFATSICMNSEKEAYAVSGPILLRKF